MKKPLFYEMDYDVKAVVENCRESKKYFCSGVRPIFAIRDDCLTSGEIKLIDCDKLDYGKQAHALIKFMLPEAYPNSIWVGRKIVFYEGRKVAGFAVIKEIMNKTLEAAVTGGKSE